jgi:hypothetical protein
VKQIATQLTDILMQTVPPTEKCADKIAPKFWIT